MAKTACIECNAELDLDEDVVLGQILQCPDCGVDLEVTALSPLTLEIAPAIEEDWGE